MTRLAAIVALLLTLGLAGGGLALLTPPRQAVPDAPRGAFAQGQTIKPSRTLITGLVDGEEVEKLTPPNGFITKKGDFDKLWKAWLLEEKVPRVDFKTSLIVVATSRKGPIKAVVLVDEKKTGDMKIKVELERQAEGKGLQVLIAVFPRAGIKTIEGKAIADK